MYSDGSNPNSVGAHLVTELSKTLDVDCNRKLYVGNLHLQATEYQVVKLFQEHGKIKREQFMLHRGGVKNGKPRGVMYIEYETEDEALAGTLTRPAPHRAPFARSLRIELRRLTLGGCPLQHKRR